MPVVLHFFFTSLQILSSFFCHSNVRANYFLSRILLLFPYLLSFSHPFLTLREVLFCYYYHFSFDICNFLVFFVVFFNAIYILSAKAEGQFFGSLYFSLFAFKAFRLVSPSLLCPSNCHPLCGSIHRQNPLSASHSSSSPCQTCMLDLPVSSPYFPSLSNPQYSSSCQLSLFFLPVKPSL